MEHGTSILPRAFNKSSRISKRDVCNKYTYQFAFNIRRKLNAYQINSYNIKKPRYLMINVNLH